MACLTLYFDTRETYSPSIGARQVYHNRDSEYMCCIERCDYAAQWQAG